MDNDLLLPQSVRECLDAVRSGGIGLVEVDTESLREAMIQASQYLSKGNGTGIVLNTAIPYSSIVEIFLKRGIPVQNFFFIDAVSKAPENDDHAQVVFLSGESALTEMSVAIQETCESLPENSFLVINTLSMMATHNSSDSLIRFLQFTLTNLRTRKFGALILSARDQIEPELRTQLVQLCDKVITSGFPVARGPRSML